MAQRRKPVPNKPSQKKQAKTGKCEDFVVCRPWRSRPTIAENWKPDGLVIKTMLDADRFVVTVFINRSFSSNGTKQAVTRQG